MARKASDHRPDEPGTPPPEAEAAAVGQPIESPSADPAPQDKTGAPAAETATESVAEPAAEPAAAPARRPIPAFLVSGGAGFVAGLLAGGALLLFGTCGDKAPNAETLSRLQALDGRIAALEKPRPAAVSPTDLEALGRRVTDVERAAQGWAKLDARIAKLEGGDPRVAALQDKLDAANRASGETNRLAAAAGEAAQRAAAALPPLAERIAALDQRIGLIASPSRLVAWPVVLGALRTALDEGRPFKAELTAAIALAGPGYERLRTLEGSADAGLATLAAIKGRFAALSRSLPAVPPVAGENFLDRLVRNAESLVRLKSTAPEGGDSPSAVLDRAQAALDRGDLAGAVAAVEKLAPDALKAAGPWLQTAKRRLDADRLIGDLLTNALAALARSGG